MKSSVVPEILQLLLHGLHGVLWNAVLQPWDCSANPLQELKRASDRKKWGETTKTGGKKEDKTLEKVGSKQNEIKEVEREKEKVLNMVYIVFYYEFDAGFT